MKGETLIHHSALPPLRLLVYLPLRDMRVVIVEANVPSVPPLSRGPATAPSPVSTSQTLLTICEKEGDDQ